MDSRNALDTDTPHDKVDVERADCDAADGCRSEDDSASVAGLDESIFPIAVFGGSIVLIAEAKVLVGIVFEEGIAANGLLDGSVAVMASSDDSPYSGIPVTRESPGDCKGCNP